MLEQMIIDCNQILGTPIRTGKIFLAARVEI